LLLPFGHNVLKSTDTAGFPEYRRRQPNHIPNATSRSAVREITDEAKSFGGWP
jgi:hypothetical protein